MIFVITFLTGVFLNDSRLMYKVFGVRMEYIKYRLILNELGIAPFCFFLIINFLKGFFIIRILNLGEISTAILTIILLYGNYLGAKPCRTGGNEIVILCGALGGFNYSLIQIPMAIFFGCLLLIRKIKTSFNLGAIFCLICLFINKYYLLFLLTFFVVAYFSKEGQSQFIGIFNSIKRRFAIAETKG